MTWQEFIKSRIATWLLAPILVAVMILAARIMVQKRDIDRQISNLEAQTDRIQRDNEELGDLIKYFSTSDFQEKQAREKLNLKKDGEYVVVLPPDEEVEAVATARNSDSRSNAKLWFDYFFNKN